MHPEYIVDLPEAKAIIADPDGAALVSVRSWKEHIGRVSGYNYIEPAGRIKGDVWGNCGTDAYHMQHYRNVDNTMRAYPEIAANWADAGITPEKWVAFYCGTGWRASETWFYADIQGFERPAVYDGGWLEWSADPENNPIETGEPVEASAAAWELPARAGALMRRISAPASAAGHRRQQQQRVALAHGRLAHLEVADVGLVDEHVDEPVDLAGVVEELRGEVRVLGDERVQHLADCRARHVEQLLAAGRGAEDGRDSDLAHADNQSSKALKRAGSTGARPGRPGTATRSASSVPNRTASGVLRPLPVRSVTTSSPGRITPRRRAASTAAMVTPPAVSV